jgi:HEAT repeat protein
MSFSRRRLVCKQRRGLPIIVCMKAFMASLVFLIMAGACESPPPPASQLPPPSRQAPVRSPVAEIGRALLEGDAGEKSQALAGMLTLDPAAGKQHQKTLQDLLRHCLSGEDPILRKEAAKVFVRMEDGLGGLVRSLDLVPESDEEVLGVALETIAATLETGGPGQKLQAVDLLSEIGKPAVGLLLKTLEDPSADLRLGALDALWSIGPSEPGLSQRVTALLKDPDRRVRQAAAAAIDRLREDREVEEQPPQRPASPRPRGG